MEKNGPVLIGIAVIGALAGVLIAGQGASLGTVSAAPGADSAAASTTIVVASNAGAPTEVTTTIAADPTATTVVDTGSTTTTLVETAVVTPTVGPTLAEQSVEDTTDIPFEAPPPDPTLDIPVETVATTAPQQESEPPAAEEPEVKPDPVVPWPSGRDRASLRLVIVNADARPDLDEAATQRLTEQGYGHVTVGDDVAPVEYTIVYYRPGFNRAAVTVTIDLEAEDVSLEPMPENLATPLTSADAEGDIIVFLGPDIPI